MTIGDLIEELSKLPADAPVVLARDAGGNNFAELASADLAGWDGWDVGLLELTDELRAEGYAEEDVRGEPAVVLWP
jgi:hypothetical protein